MGAWARDLAIWIFGAAVGVVGMLLIGIGAGVGPRHQDEPPVAAPEPDAAYTPITLEGRAAPVLPADERAQVAPAPESAAETSDSAPPQGTAIRVVLVGGTPDQRASAIVYALEAGAPGADDSDDIPHSDLDTGFVIPLVRGGTYDVGCRTPAGAALETDVAVATGETRAVELSVAPEGTIGLEFPDGVLPDDQEVWVQLVATGDDVRYLPGRRERPQYGWSVGVRGATVSADWSIAVPLGADLGVTGSVTRYEADGGAAAFSGLRFEGVPEVARAGDVVRCFVRPAVQLQVRFRSRPAAGSQMSLRLTVTTDQGGTSSSVETWVVLHTDPSGPDSPIFLPVVPGSVHLAWSGVGIKSGALQIEGLKDGEIRAVDAFVEPLISWDATVEAMVPVPGVSRDDQPVRFEGLTESEMSRYTVLVLGRFGSDHRDAPGPQVFEIDTTEETLPAPWTEALEAGAVCGLSKVAPSVPIVSGRETVFRFREGGLVVVLTDRPIPTTAGSLFLARDDGLPLPAFAMEGGLDEGASYAEARVYAEPIQVVGPFLPGPLTLRAWLGRTRLPDLQVNVRPGRITPVTLRR